MKAGFYTFLEIKNIPNPERYNKNLHSDLLSSHPILPAE